MGIRCILDNATSKKRGASDVSGHLLEKVLAGVEVQGFLFGNSPRADPHFPTPRSAYAVPPLQLKRTIASVAVVSDPPDVIQDSDLPSYV